MPLRTRMRPLYSLLLTAWLSFSFEAIAHELAPVKQLLTPESVIQASDGKVYVSEINGFGTDGDGQIRVIDHGKSSVFVQGLNDPKGLAIIGEYLYIADKTDIKRVSLVKRQAVVETYVSAQDFPATPQFLNDLASDQQGNLYVSDSGDILGKGDGGAIYKISPQRKLSLLIDGKQDARILAPNGLLADRQGRHLLVVDFTSGVLYDYQPAKKQLDEIASGFGGGDGIVRTADGHLYVSDWKTGKIYQVDPQHHVSLLKEGYQSAADIALSKDGKQLLVPDMKAGNLDVISLP
ncbi:MAG TPA: SMP-30/gluconolactonase/LRE family protein [Methylophilus sp.]